MQLKHPPVPNLSSISSEAGSESEEEDDDERQSRNTSEETEDDTSEDDNTQNKKKRNSRRTRNTPKNTNNVTSGHNKSNKQTQLKNDSSDSTSTTPHKRRKRFKLKLNTSKPKSQKNRFKVECPFCNTSNTVQISGQQFKFKSASCIKCKKEYWIHVKSSDNTPIVTKEYPFQASKIPKLSAFPNNANNSNIKTSTFSRKRKMPDSFDSEQDKESSSEIEILNDKPIKSQRAKPMAPPRKKRRRNNSRGNTPSNTVQIQPMKSETKLKPKHEPKSEPTITIKTDTKLDVDSESHDEDNRIFRFDDVIQSNQNENKDNKHRQQQNTNTNRNQEQIRKKSKQKQNQSDINIDNNHYHGNNDTYYDPNTGDTFLIPVEDYDDEEDDNLKFDKDDGYDILNNPKIDYNAFNRPYQAKMSHIEMVEPCTRSNCSDFLLGNSHCWEASPMILPGNIRMAQIGYIYQCCWCGKEIMYVEQCQSKQQIKYNEQSMEIIDAVIVDKNKCQQIDNKEQKSEIKEDIDKNKNTKQNTKIDNFPNIQQQCRVILNTLFTKWKASEGIPHHTEDGPSYSRVPFSLNDLRVKDRIMASDGTNWLPGWIEKIDKNKKSSINTKVLIHFKGWNSRWDKWYNINSGMLKTVNEYRKEKKLHSATRNEGIYEIMKHKYPNFISTSLFEQKINKKHKSNHNKWNKRRDKEEMDDDSDDDNKNNKNNNNKHDPKSEIVNAELVMMHDKNEDYMSIQELGIHDRDKYILNPPLFWSGSSMIRNDDKDGNDDKHIIELVKKSFIHLNNVLNDEDIKLIYKLSENKIDIVFFTLHCLKRPERVLAYLRLLKNHKSN